MPTLAAPKTSDPIITAFCSPTSLEVFGGIVHGCQVWSPDPLDVEEIHADAREAFARLLRRATAPEPPVAGKTLLLLGEAGSGKTHLMRAFRAAAHAQGDGYCGYMQMVTRSDNYGYYVLSKLVDSLEQPYRVGEPNSGLTRLARSLLDAISESLPDSDRDRFRDDLLEPDEIARLVHRSADLAVQLPAFAHVDIDLLRALLFLVPNDARIRPRVLKWLRCEDLSAYDRELIGGLVPRTAPHMPLQTIVALGRLVGAIRPTALVLLVDQLEEVLELSRGDSDRWELFRIAINSVVDIADAVPNAVVVIACLDQLFGEGRNHLPRAKLDRLERDPEPIRLAGGRSLEEIEAVVGRRLAALSEDAGTATDPKCPLAPFRLEHLKPLEKLRTRDVVDWCRSHRNACIEAGKWVEPTGRVEPPPPPVVQSNIELAQLWNDALTKTTMPAVEEPQLAALIAWAGQQLAAEMHDGIYFGTQCDGRYVEVETHTGGNAVAKSLVALCDKNARGGGLGTQIDEVAKRCGEIPPIIVRSTPFPSSPAAAVSTKIANLIAPKGNGRRVIVADADWRAMVAFRGFCDKHRHSAGFVEWQKQERPLAGLPSLRAIFNLDRLDVLAPTKPLPPSEPPLPPAGIPREAPTPPPPAPTSGPASRIRIGTSRGVSAAEVHLDPTELARHVAFLGGSGSGKTTAALAVIEGLLLSGVPTMLIDRKGDLARYAEPDAWTEPELDSDRAERRRALRTALDVRIYTPGSSEGRPLAIPVAPADLHSLPAADREQFAGYAASALLGMMGPRPRGADPKRAILQKAIEVLGRLPNRPMTVTGLQQLVHDRDDALIDEVGGLDDKHFKKLDEGLLTLALQHRRLFELGEPLDVDALLGRGVHAVPGRTRLTVVNTQFLGDAVDFWLAQFLASVDRWRAKNPSPDGRLQAAFFFDEADKYLPATGPVPATKAPIENLLRRARSAGIGLFLASQNPGDFDYRCRDQILTWFVGKVTQGTAIAKLKPLFDAARIDASDKLAGQSAGQFYLLKESVGQAIRVDRNLIPTLQLPEDKTLSLARP